MKPTHLIACLAPLLAACSTLEGRPPAAPSQPSAPLYMEMTDRDVELADQTVQLTLERSPSHQAASWFNRESRNSGSITPLRTYRSRSGHFCRDYRETVTVGQRSEVYEDTACRDRQGEWVPL